MPNPRLVSILEFDASSFNALEQESRALLDRECIEISAPGSYRPAGYNAMYSHLKDELDEMPKNRYYKLREAIHKCELVIGSNHLNAAEVQITFWTGR